MLTTLNAIVWFAEVLALGTAGSLDPKQAEYVDDIHGSGLHLLDLINDILDLSKVDAGVLALREEVTAVDEVLDVCRSEEHTSELQSLMRISYAVFCLKKKTKHVNNITPHYKELLCDTLNHKVQY